MERKIKRRVCNWSCILIFGVFLILIYKYVPEYLVSYRNNSMPLSNALILGNMIVISNKINDSNINSFNGSEYSLLWNGIYSKKKEVVLFLIQKGANLDRISTDGTSALDLSEALELHEISEIIKSRGGKHSDKWIAREKANDNQ
ncbi:MAG: hypothetical protein SFY92_09495 [Verrucomicrobiae bacterium]|nr:hypothetical protein [Verrucomicrobiae bacterium]